MRNQSGQDPLNFPIKTNNRLASLLRVVQAGDGRPTGNVEPIFNDLKAELKAETDRLQRVLSTYLPRFNQLAQRLGIEPISEKSSKSRAVSAPLADVLLGRRLVRAVCRLSLLRGGWIVPIHAFCRFAHVVERAQQFGDALRIRIVRHRAWSR